MSVKLHRCKFTGMLDGLPGHACRRVQKALDEQGIDYEIVKVPTKRSQRAEVVELSGQRLVPVIEFEDGSSYRAHSKEMAATIRAGNLSDQAGGGAAQPTQAKA
ncbi:MAG: glutaredoxin family protein [Solirubrobacterales bacterium]